MLRLSEALVANEKFQGTLSLASNGLTDLSALYLSKIFEKKFYNITKLDLQGNAFSSKAGEYICTALANNTSYTIFKVSFAKIHLEDIGLVHMIEAVNQNKNILKLDIGIVTNHGLEQLAELLKENTSLEEIAIEETTDHQKYWSNSGRLAFTRTLKSFT